ncbi:claudin-9-like [Denticeps clupeoides]|uniref:Claudin n=1 Tax=Denticeps clupeoides TaxID=299321 RepID=A0AAY4CDD4_9TELE|nr:claudin-9-like [Denticeps clupeoides]
MGTTGLQVTGLLLAVLGWVGGALVCAAPFWRVSAFVGDELVVSEVLWEGLWMSCLSQFGRMQCKTYDSGLALAGGAQLCRALTVLALLLCLFALLLGVIGLKCTHCLGDTQGPKARLARAAGVLFVLAGLFFLIPVCWTAYSVVREFYDPNVPPPLKRELGPALYLGWGTAVLMLAGGAILNAASAPPEPRPSNTNAGGRNNPQPPHAEGKPEKEYV